jgi:hypothetical protein
MCLSRSLSLLSLCRATPSKGFDLLASDFNKPLLALIVGGMGLVVLLLKNYNTKRILRKQWI